MATAVALQRWLGGGFDGSEEGSEEAVTWLVRRLGGGCRLACTTAQRRLSLGLSLVRRLAGGCRLACCLYDGSEEAVDAGCRLYEAYMRIN
jgi:hypothetical protein